MHVYTVQYHTVCVTKNVIASKRFAVAVVGCIQIFITVLLIGCIQIFTSYIMFNNNNFCCKERVVFYSISL